jgi:exopolyphosphatase/guanosine-5'-triphosphate,3'-diphosphate pyrophosphatase
MESVEYLIGEDGKFKGGENALMLDIGGGSNEFIISDGASVLWKKSFPIGMARMREKFNYTDPITKDVMENFIEFNKGVLVELWEMVDRYKPTLFIGSSGSFDTFRDLLFEEPHTASPSIEIPKQMLERLNDKLVVSTAQERLEMPRMSPIRVDYIVLASVFVQYVLQTLNPRIVVQSSYCLKEGAMRVKYKEYLK